jgi:hypothetical protein
MPIDSVKVKLRERPLKVGAVTGNPGTPPYDWCSMGEAILKGVDDPMPVKNSPVVITIRFSIRSILDE